MESFAQSIQRALRRAAALRPQSFFNLQVFGFSAIRAWVYLMFLGSAVCSMTWTGEPVQPFCYLISTLCLSLTLFFSAYNQKWFTICIEKPVFRLVLVGGVFLGTLCLASSIVEDVVLSTVLGVVGAVATGVGSGFIDLGYGEIYRNMPLTKTGVEVPFAFLLAAVVFALTLMLPPVIACIVCASLPVLSGVILFLTLRIFTPATRPLVRPANLETRSFALRIGMCACLVGLADGVVRAAFIETKGIDLTSFYQWPLVGGAVLTLIIIYICLAFSESDGIRSIYRWVMMIMSFFFMLLPVFVDLSWVESVIALAGYGTFNVLIWILLAEVSYRFRLSSITVFGIGWGMVTVGVLLGTLAADWVIGFAPFSPQMLSLIALAATTCILFSYMFVFKESDLIKLTREKGTNLKKLIRAATAVAPKGDGKSGTSEPGIEGNGKTEAVEMSTVTATSEKPDAENAESTSAQTGKNTKAAVDSAETGAPGSSNGDSPVDPIVYLDNRPSLRERCVEVAEQYGISPKELEVMTLFASGRSATRIQEELFISKGTVSTHLRHIYQKLEVHSKQEMIDLIEGRKG